MDLVAKRWKLISIQQTTNRRRIISRKSQDLALRGERFTSCYCKLSRILRFVDTLDKCVRTKADIQLCLFGKGKGKVLPRTGHEDPKGEQMYSSTLPSTSAIEGGGLSAPRPGRFIPQERPGTHCIGGWVGPRAGLDGWGKEAPEDGPLRSETCRADT